MLEKDSRMRSLEEMMSGIKSIKYNSLELIFDKKMASKRNKEINKLFTQQIFFYSLKIITNLAPIVNIFLILIFSYFFSSSYVG